MDAGATFPIDLEHASAPFPERAASSTLLVIDPDEVVANWRRLASAAPGATCAAVVKADAYGLGVARIAPRLHAAGCHTFFVATVPEAVALRALLPDPAGATVFALNGSPPGAEPLCRRHAIVPVANSLAAVFRWAAEARASGAPLDLALQVDTGMSRFGLPPDEIATLAGADGLPSALRPVLLMSHLASADASDDGGRNALQRRRLLDARARLRPVLGPVPASLAASSGIFLGPDYHLDMVRPGAALYGVHPGPNAGAVNPMRPTIRLDARIAQIRVVAPGDAVGYGATWTATVPTRVATVACGYADGFLRSSGNRGAAALADGTTLPVLGRISMDSLALDVSAPEADRLREGDCVSLIGPHRTVDEVAADAGTIGYEILTALGRRHLRMEGAVS